MHGSKRLLASVAAAAFLAGSAVWCVRTRFLQAEHEKELTVSWEGLGTSLRMAAARLGVDGSGSPDAWELSLAPSDPVVQVRLDSLEAKVWRELARRGRGAGMDSLREGLRRARERQGLALARCRAGTGSVPSRWVLWGYPRR